MNELTINETTMDDLDGLIEKLPGMSGVTLRWCINTGKRLREQATTRTDQDKATKLMCKAHFYLGALTDNYS